MLLIVHQHYHLAIKNICLTYYPKIRQQIHLADLKDTHTIIY